jgi:hypothetical protein
MSGSDPRSSSGADPDSSSEITASPGEFRDGMSIGNGLLSTPESRSSTAGLKTKPHGGQTEGEGSNLTKVYESVIAHPNTSGGEETRFIPNHETRGLSGKNATAYGPVNEMDGGRIGEKRLGTATTDASTTDEKAAVHGSELEGSDVPFSG